jgi:amino acid transporter
VVIVGGAAVALINDLPAMLLAVSRLMFAWAEDGIFPRQVANVHPKWHTPHFALLLSGVMASLGILGCHLAGDFFLGVDVLVMSMLVTFLLMCLSLLNLPQRNKEIAQNIRVVTSRKIQVALALSGSIALSGFLAIHIWKDLTVSLKAWYFHSTTIWLCVMAIATALYLHEYNRLRRSGVDIKSIFSHLPPE